VVEKIPLIRNLPTNPILIMGANAEFIIKYPSLKAPPQKVGLLMGLIRGKELSFCLKQLELSRKGIASDILKTLKSVMANANVQRADLAKDRWVVSTALANSAPFLKRWQPVGRGHANRIKKRRTNLVIGISKKN